MNNFGTSEPIDFGFGPHCTEKMGLQKYLIGFRVFGFLQGDIERRKA